MTEYRHFRNEVQRAAWRLRKKYYNHRLQNLRKADSRKWWKDIKALLGETTDNHCQLTSLANQLANGDLAQLAESINAFFQSISLDLKPLDSIDVNELFDAELLSDDFGLFIDPYSVERKLADINVHKSPGPDQIPNWFLRDFSVWLAEPVCCIFNASLLSGIFPQSWKQANVIPIPKVNSPTSIQSDLRPISLTPTLSKILESYVGNWILHRVTAKLDPRQFGALRGRSTTHALVDMLHTWHKALDQRQSVRVLFVDFCKAFDRVDHAKVIQYLARFEIPGPAIKWFGSFLTGRQQRVKIGNTFSSWLTLNGSMPQGSWLGPLTFIIVIDTLKLSCLTYKYVDDTTMCEFLASGQSSQFDNYLAQLSQWSLSNHMEVNERKTKEMIISASSSVNVPPFVNIERVDTFKLLGVFVSHDLKWNCHVSYICRKVNSRLHFLRQLKRAAVSCNDMLQFYVGVIRPVLEYAVAAWHTSLSLEMSDQLELLHKRAFCIIYGGSHFNSDSYASCCAELGIETLCVRRDLIARRFFHRILEPTSCLHHLTPFKRTCSQTAKLRQSMPYSIPFARSEKFRNFYFTVGWTEPSIRRISESQMNSLVGDKSDP